MQRTPKQKTESIQTRTGKEFLAFVSRIPRRTRCPRPQTPTPWNLKCQPWGQVLEEVVSDSNSACDHIEKRLDAVSERDYLNTNMLPMLRTLEKASMLPAIVFHMTRDGCVLFSLSIAEKLRQAEEIEQEKGNPHEPIKTKQKFKKN